MFDCRIFLPLLLISPLLAQTTTPPAPVEAKAKLTEVDPFVFAAAPALSSLEAGGFVPEPAFAESFDPGWDKSHPSWRVATWKQNGTQMAAERASVNADGHFVETVLAGDPPRGGSIQSTREFGYGRWIVRAKPSSVAGVNNSIFTKDWDDLTTKESDSDGKKGEVDLEFVTHSFAPGKGAVHLAIHLEKKHPLWHADMAVDFNPSDAFHEWGFDILPDGVVWHVDGKVLYTWKYTAEYRIDDNYEFFMNAWTAKKWLLGPPQEDAHYHVDWITFYPLKK